MTLFAPKPLNPRNPQKVVDALAPGDRVRITTTTHSRIVLDVTDTTAESTGPRLVLRTPTETTATYTTYCCTPTAGADAEFDSSTMTVTEYTPIRDTTECIGTLTTIARLSQPATARADAPPATMEVTSRE